VTVETLDSPFRKAAATTWFGQLHCLVLGQQQRTMMAAALIETPLCVQPSQVFTLRFQILGRDKQTLLLETQEGDHPLGLSSLVHGEKFFIEARFVLNQNDTYIMQHTTVVVPAAGYVTEVTVPIRPLSNVPSGRRDRLHLYFFDQQRHPLYDKPFVVEVFVSHFAKRGHEGYQVLTIPE
jgi:hypothetical protein